jgi:hypothetical protein
MSDTDNDRAGRAAAAYLRRGWQPLPSCRHAKKPALGRYRQYLRGEPIPADWPGRWWAPNVQLVCGVRWGLVVVDVDGPRAADRWAGWCDRNGLPPTWEVATRRGTHYWFIPPAGASSVPSGLLWGVWDARATPPRWTADVAIELLADTKTGSGKLAVAPPSVHPEGHRYAFRPGRSPADLPAPAPLPGWVAALPTMAAPPTRPRARKCVPGYTPEDRLMGPADRLAAARALGLEPAAGAPTEDGWLRCRALGREDRNPSASFNVNSGYYVEWGPGGMVSMSLRELAERFGTGPRPRSRRVG